MTEYDQPRFRDGEWVPEDCERSIVSADAVEPFKDTGFRVEIKPDALEVNASLRTAVEDHGSILEFGSRSQSERYAVQLSASSGNLRIQAAAPNDPSDVDAYLLADHNPSVTEPASKTGDTWTFDVGANLYGTLGEAILTSTPKPHALTYYVRQDLDVADEALTSELKVDVETDCDVLVGASGSDDRLTWIPDCKLVARDGWNGEVLERYYCEIKTGNASFERSQLATMKHLATKERVLKIRVLIDDLPAQYSLRIHEVEPPEDG